MKQLCGSCAIGFHEDHQSGLLPSADPTKTPGYCECSCASEQVTAEPSPEPEAAREYVYVANPYPTHYMNTPMVYPPQPDAAPPSEAQAPAVPDERPKCPDCNSVGMSHCSDPEHCGGVYWPDSKYQALRAELAQLRALVAILDAQKGSVKLAKAAFDSAVVDLREAIVACGELQRQAAEKDNLLRELRDGLVAARDFIDSGDSGWFPTRWRDAIAAYDALAGKEGE